MKKAFSFGLLAVAVALSFLSCKNNNSDLKKVTKVSLSETIKIIEVGEEFTLKETVEPVDAVDRGIVWSSDKPNVATVKDGKVKGIAEGEATITVTTNDGNKTADCKVVIETRFYLLPYYTENLLFIDGIISMVRIRIFWYIYGNKGVRLYVRSIVDDDRDRKSVV